MLKIQNISFAYDTSPVLKSIDFELVAGECVSIIGESGSGKSTLLKLIYGEYNLDHGQIFWKDTEVLGPKNNLIVGYDFMKRVSQEFDLMPFISVEENIGKYLSNFFPEHKKERVKKLLTVVELEEFANIKVKNLSGGQKQRVALARALANEPEILLLDEPFSHIDNFKKQSLRRKVFRYLKEKNIACLVATHDKEDVLGYADRMIVLHATKLIAHDTPKELFKNPNNALTAAFFGEFNVLDEYGIVYAHQLKKVENSQMKVVVKHAYFKGNYYLIEADFNGNCIFFENEQAIATNEEVFVAIDL